LTNDVVVERGDGEPLITAIAVGRVRQDRRQCGLGDVRLHDLRHGLAVASLRLA
jgi:hypothetical protein